MSGRKRSPVPDRNGDFMRYISELREGGRIQEQSAVTKNGKNYENVILQDRTGVIDAKIWDPNSDAIHEFEALDYIYVAGSVSNFNGSLQASLKQVRKADPGEYIPADYLPVTKKNRKVMYSELMGYVQSVKNPYLSQLRFPSRSSAIIRQRPILQSTGIC